MGDEEGLLDPSDAEGPLDPSADPTAPQPEENVLRGLTLTLTLKKDPNSDPNSVPNPYCHQREGRCEFLSLASRSVSEFSIRVNLSVHPALV